MNQPKRFSRLFKLSSGRVQAAFGIAKRQGSIDGLRLLHTKEGDDAFIIAITRLVKGSVLRNTLRRRVKAIIHAGIKAHGRLPAGVWLCILYPSAANRSYQELFHSLHDSIWLRKKPAG